MRPYQYDASIIWPSPVSLTLVGVKNEYLRTCEGDVTSGTSCHMANLLASNLSSQNTVLVLCLTR